MIQVGNGVAAATFDNGYGRRVGNIKRLSRFPLTPLTSGNLGPSKLVRQQFCTLPVRIP